MTKTNEGPSTRTSNGAERRNRTRTKLLLAAARVVSELGEERARIEDFIIAANVSRGTFYNYYQTREALLEDAWDYVGSEPYHEIQRETRTIEDPADRFATEARLILCKSAEDPIWGWLTYSLSDSSKLPQDFLSYPRPDLLIGHRMGRFRFQNSDAAIDMVISTLRRAVRGMLEDGRSADYANETVELLLRALGLSDAEAAAIASKPLPEIKIKASQASNSEKPSEKPVKE